MHQPSLGGQILSFQACRPPHHPKQYGTILRYYCYASQHSRVQLRYTVRQDIGHYLTMLATGPSDATNTVSTEHATAGYPSRSVKQVILRASRLNILRDRRRSREPRAVLLLAQGGEPLLPRQTVHEECARSHIPRSTTNVTLHY